MSDGARPLDPDRVAEQLAKLADECARIEPHGYYVRAWRVHPAALAALELLADRVDVTTREVASFMTYPLELDETLPDATWAVVDWR